MGYAVSAPATYSHGGYVEPGMEVSVTGLIRCFKCLILLDIQYTSSSYPVYAPQASTAVVPLSRRLTGPSELHFPV